MPRQINPEAFKNAVFVTPTGITISGASRKYDTLEQMMTDPNPPKLAYVLNATEDPTVILGSAIYLRDPVSKSWNKLWEAESMDMDINITNPLWASIRNKPTSLVTDIDDAVSKKHAHTNKSTLDLFTQNQDTAKLVFNGTPLDPTNVNTSTPISFTSSVSISLTAPSISFSADAVSNITESDSIYLIRNDAISKISVANLFTNALVVCRVVADITARNAIAGTRSLVFVSDTTGDAGANNPTALYAYNTANSSWINLTNQTVTWANIQNKPSSSTTDIDTAVTNTHAHTSSLANIDDAVAKKHAHGSSLEGIDTAVTNTHTHANSTVLSNLGDDGSGNLTYLGLNISSGGAAGELTITVTPTSFYVSPAANTETNVFTGAFECKSKYLKTGANAVVFTFKEYVSDVLQMTRTYTLDANTDRYIEQIDDYGLNSRVTVTTDAADAQVKFSGITY